jgi:hypothetical protein
MRSWSARPLLPIPAAIHWAVERGTFDMANAPFFDGKSMPEVRCIVKMGGNDTLTTLVVPVMLFV